jgi:hypothetical protein
MKINPKRIIEGLGRHGFQLGYFQEEWSEFFLVRKHGPELFRCISITQGYERGG